MASLLRFLCASIMSLGCSAALACGQVAPCEPSKPGAMTEIRGYGYGFDGGDRSVTLKWIATGQVAATAPIDENGDFVARVAVPQTPGLHSLLATLGNDDPVPVKISVPVVIPWYLAPIDALERVIENSSKQVVLFAALLACLACVAGWLLKGRRRQLAAAS